MAMSNTATRIIVSVISIPVILLASYLGKLYFAAFVLAIALMAFHEFSSMSAKKNISVNIPLGILFVLILVLNFYFRYLPNILLTIAIPFLILLFELFRNKGSVILNVGTTLLGIFYIGMFAGTFVGIREMFIGSNELYTQSGFLVISLFVSIWICDSAAFFIGTAIGKHKLFPRVSPNKSWEGAIAGFLFAVLAMVAAKYIVLNFVTIEEAISIGIIVGIIGQLGDLVESLVKRDADVKDSSAIIPGHGGIFDRFDSLLFTAPAVYLFLYYFVK